MKSTGVTRKIDELGRIVIPKEIRRNLGIRDGESLEIFTDSDNIILKKHSEMQKYSDLGQKLCDLIHNIYKFNIIITDREKIVASSFNDNIINKKISQNLINLIDNRESYKSSTLVEFNFEDVNIKGFMNVVPIIASIDSVGLIIIVNEENNDQNNLGKLMANIMAEKINIY